MDSLGMRLKEERLRLRFTQDQFSALGGVAANAQHQYERGKRVPRADYLTAIGRGGADLMYICLGIRSPLPRDALTIREAEIISYYRGLGKHDQQAIEQILQSLPPLRLIV